MVVSKVMSSQIASEYVHRVISGLILTALLTGAAFLFGLPTKIKNEMLSVSEESLISHINGVHALEIMRVDNMKGELYSIGTTLKDIQAEQKEMSCAIARLEAKME